MKIPYGYLSRQFAQPEAILSAIGDLVKRGALTLGEEVERFEAAFAALIGVPHAVGVGSGTDALFLSLKALGIGPGDEVITAVNTFVATAGAIETAGARLRFVDCDETFVLDPRALPGAITPRTRAIMPVHYSGQPVDMAAIQAIADRHGLAIVEDACTAIDGARAGVRCGAWGKLAGFSLHPIKNLHVWGDGGVITTSSAELAAKLRLLRNHGMESRDVYAFYAYNSRLDALQAVVGSRLLPQVAAHTDRRREIAARYDQAFRDLPGVRVPPRNSADRHVFHMYMLQVERRDELLAHLGRRGISAKVHYPTPLHLQPASRHLGYCEGDFPVAEAQAKRLISLPAHPYLHEEEVERVVEEVSTFLQG
jgi:dTDP-4-amino-4,6-dideoxygalactose transaminase